MIVTNIDFDGDGWHIKVGQVYSSPYEQHHFLVTKIELDSGDQDNSKIYYKPCDTNNYNVVHEVDEEYSWHRAWWVNEGNWDLERDVDLEDDTEGKRSE